MKESVSFALRKTVHNAKMKCDSVIFDLDGTLVDTFPGIVDSIRFALTTVLPNVNVSVPRTVVGPPIAKIFKHLIPELGQSELKSLSACFRNHYDNIGWKNLVPFPKAETVLKKLSDTGITNFLVTNKPKLATGNVLKHLGWVHYFGDVVSPDPTESSSRSKADVVKELIRTNELDQQKAVMVGDSIDDAEAAYMSGIKFIGVSYGYGTIDKMSAFSVDHILSELPELLSLIAI